MRGGGGRDGTGRLMRRERAGVAAPCASAGRVEEQEEEEGGREGGRAGGRAKGG